MYVYVYVHVRECERSMNEAMSGEQSTHSVLLAIPDAQPGESLNQPVGLGRETLGPISPDPSTRTNMQNALTGRMIELSRSGRPRAICLRDDGRNKGGGRDGDTD